MEQLMGTQTLRTQSTPQTFKATGIVGTQGIAGLPYPSMQGTRQIRVPSDEMQGTRQIRVPSDEMQGTQRIRVPSDSMFPSMQVQQGVFKAAPAQNAPPQNSLAGKGGLTGTSSFRAANTLAGSQTISTQPTYTSEMNQVPTTFPTNTSTGVPQSGGGMRLPLQGRSTAPPRTQQRVSFDSTQQLVGSQTSANTDGLQTGVKVDTYEDLVEPSRHAKRVTGLNRRGMHGATIQGCLSGHEHASDGNISLNFEPNPNASPAANTIVHQAMKMAQVVSQEQGDVCDKQWTGPQGADTMFTLFKTQQQAEIANSIGTLAAEVRQILASQPTLVEATVPAKVYGDIHGQFRDMLLQLFHFGFPQNSGPQFVFNGDWVDRGAHQIEVVCLVFALKAMYPNRVWILRGNHEDANQNRFMGPAGFEHACMQRFGPAQGPAVFGVIGDVFDYLPLACLIGRKILVLHGGIGNGQWTLDQLRATQRPLTYDMLPMNEMVFNILWSDPVPDDPGQEVFGAHDSPRNRANSGGKMYNFGRDVTERFCAINNIDMVIRSHQALARGFGYDVMHGGRCVRVYSARDYEGQGNDGAILSIVQGQGHLLARAQVLRSLMCPKADATPFHAPTPYGSQLDQNPFCM